LTFARASAVAQLLIDEGVPAQRVVAIGFGASRPRIPNEDAVSRHLNRRVELVLAPMAALDDQVLQLPGA
jgi:outer membrane protein OmpA-like peptidoglycan-associated protein